MVRSLVIFALVALAGSIPTRQSFADERDVQIWDLDSISPPSTWTSSPAKEVYSLEVRAQDSWNAHDLNGYLSCFWNSPNLLIVENADVIEGFQKLSKEFKEGYNDAQLMGSYRLERIKVRLLYPDLAFVFAVWTIQYGVTNHSTVGTNTEYVQKFEDGWKIVSSHASNGDL
jgi:hypothetical protein